MVKIEADCFTRRHSDAAIGCRDCSLVRDLRSDKGNKAAICHIDASVILHRPASTDSFELILCRQKIAVGYAK
ncbi:MAG: hypothetical protein IPM03_02590 [Sulfuritalea sp.]|nr:hypothetical protein [Sulfuritalea sp.]